MMKMSFEDGVKEFIAVVKADEDPAICARCMARLFYDAAGLDIPLSEAWDRMEAAMRAAGLDP